MYTLFRNIGFVLLIVLFTSLYLYAQEIESYEWQPKRNLTSLSEEESAYGLYYTKMLVKFQFVYEATDNTFACYVTNHNIIRASNDEALAKSNRVYIPMDNTIELVEVKARAIRKDNSVINFDQVNLKELESDEQGYKILAIEGAEVGGEIEYYYTRKVEALNFITRIFQFDFPVKQYNFSLTSPENIEYEFKVYNWPDQVLQVETDTSLHINEYAFEAKDIPAIYSEDFAAVDNATGRLECKLAYNTNRNNSRLFTWGQAGKRIYDQIYDLSKEEQKAVGKLIKDIGFDGDALSNFKKAEHYIKLNYFHDENSGQPGEQIDKILKNKYATSRGLTRVFAALLTHLEIDHQIVLTTSRFDKVFDPEFDTWNYLGEYLIYLEETEQFMSPKSNQFRLGTIPFGYYGTPGLFVRQEPIQDFMYPVASIAYIPETSYAHNSDNMDVQVTFTENMEQNQVQLIRSFSGYSAEYYKSGLLVLEEEEKKEMLDDIIKYMALDAEIDVIEVQEANTDYVDWPKPIVFKGSFATNSYVESAGDVILFKAGELIGPQSELYQENERTLPVVNSFNRGYERKVQVQIPEGYRIENPDDLVLNEQVANEDEEIIYKFVSSYTLEGQKLEIVIDEFYDELYYPVEKFEAFRKVINSAADFNKIVLVLSKS